ncbi:uncharacterized protein LOC133285065 [Gastrolobium bilobum]|uniref:uncharacterized protein LOC133285065 n=1 Tax=Gastrolobium bilobum TaxID=150636 RepID=UPI002AB25D5F|nr:uncharacterized protein LOC133285065 [Gastrolobium bilobum]
MDSRTQPAADRVYEDFEPYYEWAKDEGHFTVMVPGYRRDQLKVQVTSKPALKLMGERLIIENRWRRFNMEFPLPADYDRDNVSAKFEGGRLSVTFGKLIKPKEATNPPEEAPRPKEPSQNIDQQKAAQEDTPKAKDKAEARTNNVVSDQTTPKKEEKEPSNEKEKSKTETAASIDKVAQEVRTDGLTETQEAPTPEVPTTKDAKHVTRSKTRLIDFALSFGPYNQVDNEALGDLDAGGNKWKKLVKLIVLILLVVGLGLYARNAFRSSHGESNFQEL